MAITLYSGIEDMNVPELKDYGFEKFKEYEKACEDYVKKVAEQAKLMSNNPLAGEEVKFPVADGHARCILITPSKLIHLNIGDAWHFNQIKYMTAKGIKEQIKRQKALDKLFS